MNNNSPASCPHYYIDLGIELCACTNSNEYCCFSCPDVKEIINEVYGQMTEQEVAAFDQNNNLTVQAFIKARDVLKDNEYNLLSAEISNSNQYF